MKHIITLLCFVSALSVCQAQISVRVKDSPRGREVDIQAKGKQGNDKSGDKSNDKPVTTPSTSGSAPATPPTDTSGRPAGTSSFDAAYNGPAKVQLKSFWRQLDKLRAGDATPSTLNNAERMLGEVKKNDPSYNVAALEAEVAGYRQKANSEAEASKNAADKKNAEEQYFKDAWMKMVGIYSSGSTIEPGVTGKTYLDRVKEFNIEEYKEKRKTMGANAGNLPAKIDEMLADYDEYLKRTDRLKWNVTEVMTKSRSMPNPQDKIAALTEARYECEAVLIMSPGNATFKQKLDEVNKLLGNAGAEASKNYTSDFHKENVGKIVWSTKPLVIGKEKEMTAFIKKEFKTGDAIFGTAYLSNPAKQIMNGNDHLPVRIRVDNGTAIWGGDLSYIILPLAAQEKAVIQFALVPDQDWFNKEYAPYISRENWTYSYLLDELAGSGDISHTITCELMFPTNVQDDIKGGLTLDLGGGSEAIKALSTKLHDQLMASRTLPKAGMTNAGLQQQMLNAANNLGWKDHFEKVIITSSAWAVKKNELTGAILYRYVNAVCTTKSYDGKCYYQEFSFSQDYTGGGNYSSTVKFNGYGSKREIGCDKIK